MQDLDDLLDKAKTETLTDDEISYVVGRIEDFKINEGDHETLCTLIEILGKADLIKTAGNKFNTPRGLKYRKLIESFLYYPDDPNVSSIALKTLCTYWGLMSDYLVVLKEFIRGVNWDIDDELVITAVNIAGEFLRKSEKMDKTLLQMLVDIWEMRDREGVSEVNVQCAYTALARAVGEEWNDILTKDAPNPKVLDRVYHALQDKT